MASHDRERTERTPHGLGEVFRGIGSLLDLVSKLAQEGARERSYQGEVEGLEGKLRGVYGVSVRLGLGGTPIIEQFGNIRETESGPEVGETREPLADVMDEGEYIRVVVELPGVEEKDIHLEAHGDRLGIETSGKHRRYQKEVSLPASVEPQSLESSYRNGVLEVRLTKRQHGADSSGEE